MLQNGNYHSGKDNGVITVLTPEFFSSAVVEENSYVTASTKAGHRFRTAEIHDHSPQLGVTYVLGLFLYSLYGLLRWNIQHTVSSPISAMSRLFAIAGLTSSCG